MNELLSAIAGKDVAYESIDNNNDKDNDDENNHKVYHVPERIGWLYKRGVRNSAWKKRWFVLKNRRLTYSKGPNEHSLGEILLLKSSVYIEYGKDRKNKSQYQFEIAPRSGVRVYHLYASSDTIRNEWIQDIRNTAAIMAQEHEDRVNTGRRRTSAAPGFTRVLDTTYLQQAGYTHDMCGWRQALPLKGYHNIPKKELHISKLLPNVENGSCMCVHDEYNWIAIGNKHNNDSMIKIIRISGATRRVALERQFSQDSRCIDLSWSGSQLLSASLKSNVFLYRCSTTPGSDNNTQENCLAAVFKHPQQQQHAPHQTYVNARVNRVLFNTQDTTSFISLSNGSVYLWHCSRNETPLLNVCINPNAVLQAVAWSSYQAANFIVCGQQCPLSLYDIRQDIKNAPTWFVDNPHGSEFGGVRALNWCPTMPYWICSGGDDGNICIWDIRMNHSRPSVTLRGHTNRIASVCMSPSHTEYVLSTSVDATMKLWNLNIPPHYMMLNHKGNYDDANTMVSAQFSRNKPHQYFGLSHKELLGVEMTSEFLTAYCQTRLHLHSNIGGGASPALLSATSSVSNSPSVTSLLPPPPPPMHSMTPPVSSQPPPQQQALLSLPTLPPPAVTTSSRMISASEEELYIKSIEELIYLRDFQEAFSRIAKQANKYWDRGEYENCAKLLALARVSTYETIQEDTNRSFHEIMKELSYYIPETTLRITKIDADADASIKLLITRLTVRDLIEKKDAAGILLIRNDILIQVRDNFDAFDQDVLHQLILLLWPHDVLETLLFACELGQELKKMGNFQLFIPIAKTLLFPTIYHSLDLTDNGDLRPVVSERKQRVQMTDQLEREFRDARVVISLLTLLYHVHHALEQTNPSMTIINFVNEYTSYQKILPNMVHRLYYNALIHEHMYDTLYMRGMEILQLIKGYPFANVVSKLLRTTGLPSLTTYLDNIIKAMDIVPMNIIPAILQVICILYNCHPLPRYLEIALPSRLEKLVDILLNIDESFDEMTMVTKIEQIREYAHVDTPPGHDTVSTLVLQLHQRLAIMEANEE